MYSKRSPTAITERSHSFLGVSDHEYSKGVPLNLQESPTKTPTRKKRGRDVCTPTGKTPNQPSKKTSFVSRFQHIRYITTETYNN